MDEWEKLSKAGEKVLKNSAEILSYLYEPKRNTEKFL